MINKLYRIEIEVEPMEGSQLPSDCAGAYVNIYLSSASIIEAINLAEAELIQDCYKPVNTYAAFELDLEETDYNSDEAGYPNNKDLNNLQINGGVWYGPFNCYPPEESRLQ